MLLTTIYNSRSNREYKLVAISWGTHTNDTKKWIYQIQVLADDQNKDGILEISARACIVSSFSSYDFGTLGTASDMGHAVREYGSITWQPDVVTIGGTSGIKSSLERNILDK